ncbi:CPBP family intramembrane metalloprotease [Pyxidicoccus parkwayensis]|uniref:CPBP family intramembrane metalloprotease n=1 Tax=Pyxidicoccus parkwayensis TaxID=2813578 RepID=A0ABX7P922_9BACT|nr:CPBP family intramembrane glutamic endopeptidase [Pyxidicoccus parkwaysis]QSQ27008.1 CPBP family intramembrane metalloprotease [Pyxidicoccus parkwaysis]
MESPSLFRRVLRHPLTRLVLCVVATAVLSLLLYWLTSLIGLKRTGSGALGLWVMSVCNVISVVLAMWLVEWGIGRRTLAQLGLGRHRALPELGWGLLLGTGLISAVVGIMALAGWYHLVDGPPESFQDESRDALAWLAIFTAVGIFEEVAFRGIAFRLLEEWLGSAAALVISSAFFGLVHAMNPHATWFATLAIALEAGVLLGAAYMLTRSLWFAIGVHIAWNWTQGALYGVAVSGTEVAALLESQVQGPEMWTGGAFGAEAGGVAVLLCTAAGVLLLLYAVRRGQWIPFMPRRRARREAAATLATGETSV